MKLVVPSSVARVQPRTSKGITDLLLPATSFRYNTQDGPSKKYSALQVGTDYLAGAGLVR